MKYLLLLLCATASASEIHTNLPVIIRTVLVTNVVEGNNETGCRVCKFLQDASKPDAQGRISVPAIYHPAHSDGLPFGPATERWVITNVMEDTVITFTWGEEKMQAGLAANLISSTTNRWVLKSTWREVTEPPPLPFKALLGRPHGSTNELQGVPK